MSSDTIEIQSPEKVVPKKQEMNGRESTNEEHEEYQYLRLIRKVIKTGARKSNRTEVDTYSIFGAQMRFGLRDGKRDFHP